MVKKPIYTPAAPGSRMTIACFASGSGTNYREIVRRCPSHHYLLFTNRPGCGAAAIAREFGHDVIELTHIPYLREARNRYRPGNVPRDCIERVRYEQAISSLIEGKLGRKPDLICLAGYDQWVSDWMVDRYSPTILNVHPGDTTKGYDGLHWLPSAKAILAGEDEIRSTLFLVDKGEDTGPVLVQSAALNIKAALGEMESKGASGLLSGLDEIKKFASNSRVSTWDGFAQKASPELKAKMERICSGLQEALKKTGDWKIYPFAVHDLIGKGRVEIDGRNLYVDGKQLPEYGYRLD